MSENFYIGSGYSRFMKYRGGGGRGSIYSILSTSPWKPDCGLIGSLSAATGTLGKAPEWV